MVRYFQRSRLFSLIVLAACVVSCTGSPTNLTIAPNPGPTALALAPVNFSIVVPKSGTHLRKPNDVPSDAQSVVITPVVLPPATPPPPIVIEIGTGASNCTSSVAGLTCTGSGMAPVGTDEFVITFFSQPSGNGSQLTVGQFTATVSASGSSQTISNNVALTLDPIVASISLAASPSSVAVNQTQAIALTVNAYDATGAIIVGSAPFANGNITISLPAGNPFFPSALGTVAVVTSPASKPVLQYQGSGQYARPEGGSLTVTATSQSGAIAPASTTITFLPLATPTPTSTAGATPTPTITQPPTPTPTPATPTPSPTPVPQFNVSPTTITFAGVAPQPTQTFTATESGVSSFTAVSSDTSIATVSGSGSTFTVTAGANPGTAGITVTDPIGRTASVTVYVSGQVIIIQTHQRKKP